MACGVCFDEKRLVCQTCVTKVLRDHRNRLQRYKALLKTSSNKAEQALVQSNANSSRSLKAKQANLRDSVDEAKESLFACHASIRKKTLQVATRKEQLQSRRSKLQEARRLVAPEDLTDDPFSNGELKGHRLALWKTSIAAVEAQWTQVADEIAEARCILVAQLMDVYNIQVFEDEDEAAQSPGTLLCRISGAFMPTIADIQRYPPNEVAAAISHTVYLVRLVAMYMGIRLPFLISPSSKMTIRSAPMTMWLQKWPGKYPLHLAPAASAHQSPGIPDTSSSKTHLAALVTGLTMLAYNALFLCSALRPLPARLSTDNVLFSLLHHFGRTGWRNASHSTAKDPLKEVSVAAGKDRDFAQLVEHNLGVLAASLKESPVKEGSENEDWNLVEKEA